MKTLEGVQRQIECFSVPLELPYEKRYPYLDRDLLEFLYAVPREQLLRPGQRRSLMRRALVGIVPNELLQRKRKAFVSRGHLVALKENWPDFLEFNREMVSGMLGVLDPSRFVSVVQH